MIRLLAVLLVLVGLWGSRALADPWGLPQIDFVGNHAVATADLLAVADDAVRKETDPYDPDCLDRLSIALSSYYWDRGYYEAKIDPPRASRADYRITVVIIEGLRFRLGPIAVNGWVIGDAASNLEMLKVHRGDVFSRKAVEAGVDTLRRFYEDHGYAQVSIVPSGSVDRPQRTVAMTFTITPGKPMRFGKVTISGNHRIDEATVRRAVTVVSGALYNGTELDTTKARVAALGFREVVASIKAASPDVVDVFIDVDE
jgi:outer membrane protein insertion porin family